MAGSLIKIDEEIVTSAVASVTLTGIDSTYDVYMVKANNIVPATDGTTFRIRFTESGTPNTSANYDYADKELRASEAFANDYATNATEFFQGYQVGSATGEQAGGTFYIFNANNSSEYTFFTYENFYMNNTPKYRGQQGGGVLTVTSAVDGIHFFFDSSVNIASGTFTLYGLKK